MSIKSIMTSPVVTVTLDDTLSTVNELFSHDKFHHLLVVENDKLFGVISDRDLLKALSPNIGTAAEKANDTATLNKKVHQVMSRKPISVDQNKSIYDAIELFMSHKISCIPVVDSKNAPVGMISWRDILKAIRKPKQK